MKNRPVIVLGLGPAGLFLVRQLSRITGNIYAVGRHDDVGLYSKYIAKKKRFYATSAFDLKKVLKKINMLEKQRPLLYICSDQYLSMLLDDKDQWSEDFDLAGADIDTLELINNKHLINGFCLEHGLNIPKTFSLTEFRENAIFPVIIKWVEKRIETAVNPIGKVCICRNGREFEEVDNILREGGIRDDELFIQTYIEGKNDLQFSVGGVYRTGECLVNVVVNQVKQYPQGISAEVVTCSNSVSDGLRAVANEFAKELGYSGFLEIEFKIDELTKEIFLLDINPRPWGWISILGVVFSDFYRVLIGEQPKCGPYNARWKSPLRVFLGKKNKQNVEPVLDFRGGKLAYDIRDLNDCYPSFMIPYMVMKKILRRIKC